MLVKCLNCQKEFKTYPSRIKVGYGKCCSRKCVGEHFGFAKGYTPYNKGTAHDTVMIFRHLNRRVIMFPDRSRKYYYRHLMEQHLGRELLPIEQVHHKDGNPLNDTLGNLELMDIRDHSSLHSRKRYGRI